MANDDWRSLATCSDLPFPKITSARTDDAIHRIGVAGERMLWNAQPGIYDGVELRAHIGSAHPVITQELVKALAACKKQKAKLVIAKLDRLSRNLALIATLMDSGVEFVAVDIPHANKLTIHIVAAVAQHEREIISARTSAALKAVRRQTPR